MNRPTGEEFPETNGVIFVILIGVATTVLVAILIAYDVLTLGKLL